MADEKNSPDWEDPRLEAYEKKWARADAALGGTDAMREASTEYLPQYPAENDDNYDDRVSVSTFYPAYEDTLKGATGMVFRKPLKLADTVPAQIKSLWADLDLMGTHGDVFAQRVFFAGLHRGAAYVLIDMQAKPESLQNAKLDRSQAQQLNLRPYAVLYDAKKLAQLPRFVAINGKVTLQQIVFEETIEVEDGDFGYTCVERARVWRLPVTRDPAGQWQRIPNQGVLWQIWEEQEVKTVAGQTQPEWVVIAEGQTDLQEIPVAIFNASPDPDDPKRFRGPVCNELAIASVEHFQLKSEQRKVLRRCVPVPFSVNLNEQSRQAVEESWGPDMLLHCDADGKLDFAEPLGASLDARRLAIGDTKQEIHDLGLSLVVEKSATSNTSATKERLDMQTRSSKLSEAARTMKDTLDTVLYHFAAWLRLPTPGTVDLGIKDVDLIITAQDLSALNAMANDRNMSLRDMWAILARGGWLPDDFDADTALDQIEKEQKRFTAVTTAMPSNGMPVNNLGQPKAQPNMPQAG